MDQVPVGGQVDRAARFGRQQGALVEPAAIAMGGGRVHDPARGAGRRRARRTPRRSRPEAAPSRPPRRPQSRGPPPAVRRARSGCASAVAPRRSCADRRPAAARQAGSRPAAPDHPLPPPSPHRGRSLRKGPRPGPRSRCAGAAGSRCSRGATRSPAARPGPRRRRLRIAYQLKGPRTSRARSAPRTE